MQVEHHISGGAEKHPGNVIWGIAFPELQGYLKEIIETAYSIVGFSTEQSRTLAQKAMKDLPMPSGIGNSGEHGITKNVGTDIIAAYLNAFPSSLPEAGKISQLAAQFKAGETGIIQVLREANIYRISSWPGKQKYLEELSDEKLNDLYLALAGLPENVSDQFLIAKIRQITSQRSMANDLFRKAKLAFESFEVGSDIEGWSSFELDFGTPLIEQERIGQIIRFQIPDHESIPGIYAIFNGGACLYIGTGMSIPELIYAHYLASHGPGASVPPADVFSQYRKILKIHWKGFRLNMPESIALQALELIKSILKIKYRPLYSLK